MHPVGVEPNRQGQLLMPLPRRSGVRPGAAVTGFFFGRTQPPMRRGQHGRHGGNPVLWESSETPGELAKAAALSERLPGVCGSVGHGEGLALNREG